MRGVGLALVFTACAAPTVPAARRAAYSAPPDEVWRVVMEELAAAFPALLAEDADAHRATTCWSVVERNTGGLSGGINTGWKLYRIEAAMSAAPPWRVRLTGVAAEYVPGTPVVTPIQPGGIEEPYWVGPRTDRVYGRIYQRLRSTASIAPTAADPKEATLATTPRRQENLESTCIFDHGAQKGIRPTAPQFRQGRTNPGEPSD